MCKLVSKRQRKDGLYTSEQGRLLNKLGFEVVTIVTANLDLIDFSWDGLSKKCVIQRMKKLRTHYKRICDKCFARYVNDMILWLEDSDYDNQIIIDNEFKKHIKHQLNRGIPVGALINWTSLFKFTKGSRCNNGDITGVGENHAIVLRGYDNKGVFVVDSNVDHFTGKRKKYRRGYYKLLWEKFLVNIPGGDLILL